MEKIIYDLIASKLQEEMELYHTFLHDFGISVLPDGCYYIKAEKVEKMSILEMREKMEYL